MLYDTKTTRGRGRLISELIEADPRMEQFVE